MKCSRCWSEKSDFAEDQEFAVLDIEDYKRICVLGIGRPMGVRWEIEGWKVKESGRYRSGVCTDCAKTIMHAAKRKRLLMTTVGLSFLVLSWFSISRMDTMPIVGLIGGWFAFPILGFIMLILAYQLNMQAVAFDVYHRKAWVANGGKTLLASYGVLPRQGGVRTRFVLENWEQIRASYEEERRESGWSHFLITLHANLIPDEHPSKQSTLERFKAAHMGEIMDQYPHSNRPSG